MELVLLASQLMRGHGPACGAGSPHSWRGAPCTRPHVLYMLGWSCTKSGQPFTACATHEGTGAPQFRHLHVRPFQPALLQVYQSEVEVIEGSLPADLSGVFLRNGPNPKLPVDGGYHW